MGSVVLDVGVDRRALLACEDRPSSYFFLVFCCGRVFVLVGFVTNFANFYLYDGSSPHTQKREKLFCLSVSLQG